MSNYGVRIPMTFIGNKMTSGRLIFNDFFFSWFCCENFYHQFNIGKIFYLLIGIFTAKKAQ